MPDQTQDTSKSPPSQSWSRWECAAAGCNVYAGPTPQERHELGGLERISLKGGPFVGLCHARHAGHSVVLKPEAAALMGTGVN